jgi:isopenicillin N synthase-like dioxygenase
MNYSEEFLSLYNNLYAVVDYPQELADEVKRVALLWQDFCTLPLDVKRRCSFIAQHEDWNSGYINRTKEAGHDNKEYYHVQPNHAQLVEQAGLTATIRDYPVIKDFFDRSEHAVELLKDFVEEIAGRIAKDNPHLADLQEQFIKGYGENYSLLRFLHYTPDPDQYVIAEPHFDIGGMTFHVYESAPGLQFMKWDNSWEDAPLLDDKTLMFNAYGLEHMSDGVLQRTWHRVIQTAGSEGNERYSGVFFVDFPNGSNWDTVKQGRAKLQPRLYEPQKPLK